MTATGQDQRELLRSIFDAAVASANPALVLPAHLPAKPRGRCIAIGAGKASAAMAAALDAAWPDAELSGVVVTRYGHAVPAGRIEIIEAAHPIPDANSERAARRILAAVQNLTADDLVIALISGGGSALLCAPAGAITLAEKQAINRDLLSCGAGISEINTIRKHLSAIKGGRLARAAHPARVVTLLISDVPGDDPATIASGPTVADASTIAEARAIIARYRLTLPPSALAVLATGEDTPKHVPTGARLIATPMLALQAAAAAARAAGFSPLILGDAIEGEAAALGITMAGIAKAAAAHGHPIGPPCVLLSGGETTVALTGEAGQGGRNQHFALSLAIALNGAPNIWALAADSDGIDGNSPAAGAFVTPDTLARARAAGLNPRHHLTTHNSHIFFRTLDDLVCSGPTNTNVNDFRAILIPGNQAKTTPAPD